MTYEEVTANFITDDRECEFCGDELPDGFEECSDCRGMFCSTECFADHLKQDSAPRCGGNSA